jgi:site-specific DNA recombinase
MGFAGRFAEGKAHNHPAPYGYSKDGEGHYVVDPTEGEWVVRLFRWYAEGISVREIRRRFIAGGAPQRRDTQIVWHMALLRRMLTEDYYWTGKHIIRWGGEVYEIPLPPLVTIDLAEDVQARKSQFRRYPAGNTRNSTLAAGLTYCTVCNVRCSVISATDQRPKKGPRTYVYYQCSNVPNIDGQHHFKRARASHLDSQVWDRVWTLISDTTRFETALQAKIAELQAQEIDAKGTCERLGSQIEQLALERQRVITWARKGLMTEDDLEMQLAVLSNQESEIKRELAEKQLLLGNRADGLIRVAESFRRQVMAGWEAVNSIPATPEQERLQFEFRRRIVQGIVERVDINPDKTVRVHARIRLDGTPNVACDHRTGRCAGQGR